MFSNDIANAADNALATAIQNAINTGLNNVLATIPIQEPINPQVEVNFELLDNPNFNTNYFTLPQSGEFYNTNSPSECTEQVCPTRDIPDYLTNNMMQMIVSDYVVNSAGNVFYGLGQLSMIITDSDIPPWSPVHLNTTDFRGIFSYSPDVTRYFTRSVQTLSKYVDDHSTLLHRSTKC